MVAAQLEYVRPWDRRCELALLPRSHEAILRGHDYSGGNVDIAGKGAGVVIAEGPAGVGDGFGIASTKLATQPAVVRVEVGTESCCLTEEAVKEAARCSEAKPVLDERHGLPQQTLPARRTPFERGCLEDEAAHKLRVALPQQHRDRAAHGVADDDRRSSTQVMKERGDVVSRSLEREPLL